MPSTSEREAFQQRLKELFPGDENIRIRDAFGYLRSSCEDLQMVGSVLSKTFGSIEQASPSKRDVWEFMVADDLHCATTWLSRLQGQLIVTYTELRNRAHKRLAEAAHLERIRKQQYEFDDRIRQQSFSFEKGGDGRSVREGIDTPESVDESERGSDIPATVGYTKAAAPGVVEHPRSDNGFLFAEAAGIFDEKG